MKNESSIPNDVIGGLLTDKYERMGGIIQDQMGNVIGLLKESFPLNQVSPFSLSEGLPKAVVDKLNLYGSMASFLNLGITTSFGGAVLEQLDNIESKIDIIDYKIDNLQISVDIINDKINEIKHNVNRISWMVELGFINTFVNLEKINASLNHLKLYHEINLISELKTASILAMDAQFNEPNTLDRREDLKEARTLSRKVLENWKQHAQIELNQAIQFMNGNSADNLSIDSIVINALYRIRQVCIAASLNASVSIETDSISSAVNQLETTAKPLKEQLKNIGKMIVQNSQNQHHRYLALLHGEMLSALSSKRIQYWLERFDPKYKSLDEIFDTYFRNKTDYPVQLAVDRQNYYQINGLQNFLSDDYCFILKQDFNSLSTRLEIVIIHHAFNPELKLKLEAYRPDRESIGIMIPGPTGAQPHEQKFSISDIDQETFTKLTSSQLFDFSRFSLKKNENTDLFFELFDATYEDVNRLLGYALELKQVEKLGINIHEYRKFMQINELYEDKKLVYVKLEDLKTTWNK